MSTRSCAPDPSQHHTSATQTKTLGRRKSLFSIATEFWTSRSKNPQDDVEIELETRQPALGKWNPFSTLRGLGSSHSTKVQFDGSHSPSRTLSPSKEHVENINEHGMLGGKRRKSLHNIFGTVGSKFGTGRKRCPVDCYEPGTQVENLAPVPSRQYITECFKPDSLAEPLMNIPWILRLQDFNHDTQSSEPSPRSTISEIQQTLRRDSGVGLDAERQDTSVRTGQTLNTSTMYTLHEEMTVLDDCTPLCQNAVTKGNRPGTPDSYLRDLIEAADSICTPAFEKLAQDETQELEPLDIVDVDPQFLNRAHLRDHRHSSLFRDQKVTIRASIVEIEASTDPVANASLNALSIASCQHPADLSEVGDKIASSATSMSYLVPQNSPTASFTKNAENVEKGKIITQIPSPKDCSDIRQDERHHLSVSTNWSKGKAVGEATMLTNGKRLGPGRSDSKITSATDRCRYTPYPTPSPPPHSEICFSDSEPAAAIAEHLPTYEEVEQLESKRVAITRREISPTRSGGSGPREPSIDFSEDDFWDGEADGSSHIEVDTTIKDLILSESLVQPNDPLYQFQNFNIERHGSTTTLWNPAEDTKCEERAHTKTWAELGQEFCKKYSAGLTTTDPELRAEIAVCNAIFALGGDDRDFEQNCGHETLNGYLFDRVDSSKSDICCRMEYCGNECWDAIDGCFPPNARSWGSGSSTDEGTSTYAANKENLTRDDRHKATKSEQPTEEQEVPDSIQEVLSTCLSSDLSELTNKSIIPSLNMRIIGRQARMSRLARNRDIGFAIAPNCKSLASPKLESAPSTIVKLRAESQSKSNASSRSGTDTEIDLEFGAGLERFGPQVLFAFEEIDEEESEARYWRAVAL